MTRPYGTTVAAIERLLHAQGRLTARELAQEIGVARGNVSPVLRRMMTPRIGAPKRVHIAGWTREVDGTRSYLRPQYDLGDEPNYPKPKRKTGAASQRDYRINLRRDAWGSVSSVFNIGDRRL